MGYFFTARFSYACTISSKFGKSCYFLARCILMLAVAATYLKMNVSLNRLGSHNINLSKTYLSLQSLLTRLKLSLRCRSFSGNAFVIYFIIFINWSILDIVRRVPQDKICEGICDSEKTIITFANWSWKVWNTFGLLRQMWKQWGVGVHGICARQTRQERSSAQLSGINP